VIPTALETGFALDRLYRWMEGSMQGSKRPTLAQLARILADVGTPYALIGGVAVQIQRREPRTTLDIDVVLHARSDWPARAFEKEGFRRTGAFEHSENWESADGTPVQITDDALLAAAIERAEIVEIDGLPLRVLTPLDLLRAKLRAAADPARRRSKRLLDLADAQGLVEDHAELAAALDAAEREILEQLRP
jgi:predicted nucleotidyltransferase